MSYIFKIKVGKLEKNFLNKIVEVLFQMSNIMTFLESLITLETHLNVNVLCKMNVKYVNNLHASTGSHFRLEKRYSS